MAEILLQKALNDQHIDIPELRYGYNEYGKPYIPGGPEFSISHCKHGIAVAVDEYGLATLKRVYPYPEEGVVELVAENPDGTYSLYIDANAPYAEQLRVYWHEYEHLAYDDFGSGKALRDLEEGLQ